MTYFMCLFLIALVMGLIAVASNPSPFFAAFGLVVVAGVGCVVLVGHGGPFLSLILFLIYLGGMLVVFAYSAAMAAEPYPEAWGSWPVAVKVGLYSAAAGLAAIAFSGGWSEFSWVTADEFNEFTLFRGDIGGVALVYSGGGEMLAGCAWVLLLTLFVVLELTRGLSRGALRYI